MTQDISRLAHLEKWIWKRIRTARSEGDKKRYKVWLKRHEKVIELIDKLKFRELHKIY